MRLSGFCTRHAIGVIALAVILATSSAVYAVQHFAIQTDVTELFPSDLLWTRRAFEFLRAFPQPDILVVVDAPTSELVEQAADKLAHTLKGYPDHIRAVHQLDGGGFFERNGLLFLPTDEVARVTGGLSRATDLIQTLNGDPSLRGSLNALSLGLMGVEAGIVNLDDLARPMTMAADTASAVLAGRSAAFSWQALAGGAPQRPAELRRFIAVEPVLDYSALEPGRAAIDAIRSAAQGLVRDDQARIRLTGLVPVNDDGFATLKQTAPLTIAASILGVLVVLWLALRSLRIILAVVISLFVGLAISAAWGIFLVGTLNLISAAFIVLFVGLGVDFGIQFSVRYRAERHDFGDLRIALTSAATKAGVPLALAAAATALGFSCFVPTAYRGLGELGQIAGSGMIIAVLTSITLLPALLMVLDPPGEPHPMGFAALAPIDRFIRRRRVPIVVTTLVAVGLASPLLLFLPFDFNPLHLRNPKAPAVATFLELRKDSRTGTNAVEIVTPNLNAADAIAERLSSLPQVAWVMTLDSLVPTDQEQKLALIRSAARALDPVLRPQPVEPPPTDQKNIAALSSTSESLTRVAADAHGSGAEAAGRLSELLTQLARSDQVVRQRFSTAVVEPLKISLDRLKKELAAQHINTDTIPAELARQWVTTDGRARVQVLPKGEPDDTGVIRSFVSAVLAIAPDATGPAVELYEAGNTVVRSFIEAGVFALTAITVLLLIVLRRAADVLLTLVPLLVAAVVTLEVCVVIDLPLNFANIIALPLLFGVGVAFKIYYVMAWRTGKTDLVQSTLTRAVVFSAMATATAFGSLWLSDDPGTSSMGKLMVLSLICTMTAAVLFQPALMGPPRMRRVRRTPVYELATEYDTETGRRVVNQPTDEAVER